jgi:hypothetical protein
LMLFLCWSNIAISLEIATHNLEKLVIMLYIAVAVWKFRRQLPGKVLAAFFMRASAGSLCATIAGGGLDLAQIVGRKRLQLVG